MATPVLFKVDRQRNAFISDWDLQPYSTLILAHRNRE